MVGMQQGNNNNNNNGKPSIIVDLIMLFMGVIMAIVNYFTMGQANISKVSLVFGVFSFVLVAILSLINIFLKMFKKK